MAGSNRFMARGFMQTLFLSILAFTAFSTITGLVIAQSGMPDEDSEEEEQHKNLRSMSGKVTPSPIQPASVQSNVNTKADLGSFEFKSAASGGSTGPGGPGASPFIGSDGGSYISGAGVTTGKGNTSSDSPLGGGGSPRGGSMSGSTGSCPYTLKNATFTPTVVVAGNTFKMRCNFGIHKACISPYIRNSEDFGPQSFQFTEWTGGNKFGANFDVTAPSDIGAYPVECRTLRDAKIGCSACASKVGTLIVVNPAPDGSIPVQIPYRSGLSTASVTVTINPNTPQYYVMGIERDVQSDTVKITLKGPDSLAKVGVYASDEDYPSELYVRTHLCPSDGTTGEKPWHACGTSIVDDAGVTRWSAQLKLPVALKQGTAVYVTVFSSAAVPKTGRMFYSIQ